MQKGSGLSVKYWLRMENGTENAILNETFLEAKTTNTTAFKMCYMCNANTVSAIYGSIL